jgi:hypothetical protein
MTSHFSHNSIGSPASIVSGRGKQVGAWAVGTRSVNNVKGGMWWYVVVWAVALGVMWCMGGVVW